MPAATALIKFTEITELRVGLLHKGLPVLIRKPRSFPEPSTLSFPCRVTPVAGRGKGIQMNFDNVVALCPREVVSLEPLVHHAEDHDEIGLAFAEDAIEEMVVCLAAIEAAWSAGEFARLETALKSAIELAERTGLIDVAHVAVEASGLIGGYDEVALAAVVARLVRVGETSLATLLEISYRQI